MHSFNRSPLGRRIALVAASAAIMASLVGAGIALANTPTPSITSVKVSGYPLSPVVTIHGSNFGASPSGGKQVSSLGCGATATGVDYPNSGLWLLDGSRSGGLHGAFQEGSLFTATAGNCGGDIITQWTSTKVIFHFGSRYLADSWHLQAGDKVCVAVKDVPACLTLPTLPLVFAAATNIDGSNVIESVSCPSTTFCAAVDNVGNVLTYNGTAWSAPDSIDPGVRLNGVSCYSAAFCMAVGDSGDALSYNGTWSFASDIDGSFGLTSISCPSATFCVAVDGNSQAFTYSASTWSSATFLSGSSGLSSVSCPSVSFCAAVDNVGTEFDYTNGSWSPSMDIDGTQFIYSVSCPAASFCTAVDGGTAQFDNNLTWATPVDIDGTNPLSSVSCPLTSFCETLDKYGYALNYNGTSWTSATNIDSPHVPTSVSCPTASFCVVVDDAGNALVGMT